MDMAPVAFSTPAVPSSDNLRRRTLINQSILRRSSIAPVLSEIQEVNDDEERSSRRNEAHMQKRLSNISNISIRSSVSKFTGEDDMKSHFQVCTKLFTENKINSKNVWKLQIIDVLRSMSVKPQESLLLAGTSLDISAKVYSIRVDDAHSEGLKLASGMARMATTNDVDSDNDEQGGDNRLVAKKKKKRIMLKNKNTIASDVNALLGSVPKLESVFFRSKFMLLNKDIDTDSTLKISNIISSDQLTIPTDNCEICTVLRNFVIDEWDPDEEEQVNSNEVVFDANGIPIAELDGSIHDIFLDENNYDNGADDMLEVDEDRQGLQAQFRGDIAHVVDIRPDATMPLSEYSFNTVITANGRTMDRIWAGPGHWRLKFIRPQASRFSGSSGAKPVMRMTKARRQRLNQEIDVKSNPEFDLECKAKVVNISMRDNIKLIIPTMEFTRHEVIKLTRNLMIKPDSCPRFKKDCESTEVQKYNYDNQNDSLYCSQANLDDDDEAAGGDDIEECVAQENQEPFMGDNMVEAPEMVSNVFVPPYALLAKRMDMKKLKTAVWKHLTGADNTSEGTVAPTIFSNIYQNLPNLVTESMKKELSCPLAFVALLHLTNEQNLELIWQERNDFKIVGPSKRN